MNLEEIIAELHERDLRKAFYEIQELEVKAILPDGVVRKLWSNWIKFDPNASITFVANNIYREIARRHYNKESL